MFQEILIVPLHIFADDADQFRIAHRWGRGERFNGSSTIKLACHLLCVIEYTNQGYRFYRDDFLSLPALCNNLLKFDLATVIHYLIITLIRNYKGITFISGFTHQLKIPRLKYPEWKIFPRQQEYFQWKKWQYFMFVLQFVVIFKVLNNDRAGFVY